MLASVDAELLDMYDEGEGEGEVDPVVDMMHRLSNRKMNIWFGSLIAEVVLNYNIFVTFAIYMSVNKIKKKQQVQSGIDPCVYYRRQRRIITFPHLSSNHQ